MVVVLCALRKLTFGVNDNIALPSTFMGWLATLTLTTSPLSSVTTINWIYWSLVYEVFFYLARSVSVVWPRLWILWPLTLCGAALHPTTANAIFFLNHCGLFAVGIALALAELSKKWAAVALAATGLGVTSPGHTGRKPLWPPAARS